MIRACVENAKVPCIQTGTGICHIFVDESADLDCALDIIENAKASRPSVANAEEVAWYTRPLPPCSCPAWPRDWVRTASPKDCPRTAAAG